MNRIDADVYIGDSSQAEGDSVENLNSDRNLIIQQQQRFLDVDTHTTTTPPPKLDNFVMDPVVAKKKRKQINMEIQRIAGGIMNTT